MMKARNSIELIKEAKELPYRLYQDILLLIEEATDQDTIDELDRIMRSKYHEEEYRNGCL